MLKKLFKTPIRHKVLIHSSVEKIFLLISTSQGWDAWFTTGTVFEFGLEKTKFVWKNWGADQVDAEASVKIEEIIPNKKVLFYWNYTLEGGPTKVLLELEAKDQNRTILSVTESGYPMHTKGEEMLIECSTGWGEALTLIKFYAEHGIRY